VEACIKVEQEKALRGRKEELQESVERPMQYSRMQRRGSCYSWPDAKRLDLRITKQDEQKW